jgi:hypothetical protein
MGAFALLAGPLNRLVAARDAMTHLPFTRFPCATPHTNIEVQHGQVRRIR